MRLSEVYRAYGDDSDIGAQARQLLTQQHWYASIAEFDPRSGEALPLSLNEVLFRLAHQPKTAEVHDRLWRIVNHCRLPLEHIFGSLSEEPRREQARLPIRDVKEVNAASFIALSRRPGRNIREKLAGKPYMQAVRRYQSVDLPHNRLVKEFASRLAESLELRKKYLGLEDDLLGDIYRWLRTDDARAIGRWDNVPANNTLLSHRDYRRVWDAWTWLQDLDDTIARDFSLLERRSKTVAEWDGHTRAYSEGQTAFGGMPVLFDYDRFEIKPWTKKLVTRGGLANVRRDSAAPHVVAPVCVDLTYLRPRFAVDTTTATVSEEIYLWQRWTHGKKSVDLELFDADAACEHPDATTLTCTDLFFANDLNDPLLDFAAHRFARRLSNTFTNSALAWLYPDFLNDFQLQVTRRNLNARFAEAEPVPRSVASLFEKIDCSKIKAEGFEVLVVDSAGGTTYATKLIARHDRELQERVPETCGFFWERSPHITLDRDESSFTALAEVSRFDADGRWIDSGLASPAKLPSSRTLRADPRIGDFNYVISVSDSPVRGGIRLLELQKRAGDLPLWRDQIPELSIKVIKHGSYQPFFLVDRGTTVRPVRGMAVPIPVQELFTLPAGKPYYQFPLFQGADPDDLGYVARLESPAFPLAADVTCRLTMTYSYGADDPYRLAFEPLDGSFKPVLVKWRAKAEEIITDAPAPGYPTPLSWEELQDQYDARKGRRDDYLDWVTRATTHLLDDIEFREASGTIQHDWKPDRNGRLYTHVGGVFVHEGALRDGVRSTDLRKGDLLHYHVAHSDDGRQHATNVSTYPTAERPSDPELPGRIRSRLYFPYIKTWGDGRSVTDTDCPSEFRDEMASLAPRLEGFMRAVTTPIGVQRQIRFLLCCMHRDMPKALSRDLETGTAATVLDERAYAFALGDLTEDWQYNTFLAIWNRGDEQMLSIFAQAIWRSENFVRVFDAPALEWLVEVLLDNMSRATSDRGPVKGTISRLTKYCELILGLLRSRDSDEGNVRLTLQPHQELTKRLAEQVEVAAALVEESGLEMRSRVEISDLPDKPAGDETPDLLYALRLYLTGDVGANAIRVTGVNEGEDE